MASEELSFESNIFKREELISNENSHHQACLSLRRGTSIYAFSSWKNTALWSGVWTVQPDCLGGIPHSAIN